jgi:MFS family permease
MSAAYAISSPISGWFAGRMENKAPLMVIGLMMTSVAYVLLGPSKFLQLEPTFWLSAVSMMIIGLAYSLAFIPTFEYILEAVIERGLPDDVKTYSLVSGLWSCINSLGEVTGAGLGGIFIDYFSFTFGANSIAIWTMGVAVLLLITYLWELCCVHPDVSLRRASWKRSPSWSRRNSTRELISSSKMILPMIAQRSYDKTI